MFFIAAPFGNYLNFKNSISVSGTWTRESRPGRFTQILKTLRYTKDGCVNKLGLRESLREKMPTPEFKFTTENIKNLVSDPPRAISSQEYNPGNKSTIGEGSALPEGEVSMNQIANLMSGK